MFSRAYRRRLVVGAVLGLCALSLAGGRAGAQQPMLPAGDTLMDNYIKATGGKDAYTKVKSSIMKGNVNLAGAGVGGDLIAYAKAPKLAFVSIDMKVVKVETGFDGKVYWESNSITGAKIVDPKEAKDSMPGLDLSSDVNWREDTKSAKTEAEEKYKGKEVYRVKIEKKNGDTEFRYFDKANGLIVRQKKFLKGPMGNVTVDFDIGDYKKFGDLLVPCSATGTLFGQTMVLTISSIEINPKIADSQFEPPASVKELIKSKEKDQPKKEQPKDSDK